MGYTGYIGIELGFWFGVQGSRCRSKCPNSEVSGPHPEAQTLSPRGSIYTTISELGPKIPYYRRNYGSQFPNGCICGPSGSP